MSGISLQCPSCKCQLKRPPRAVAGTTIRCPRCKSTWEVPADDEPELPPVPAMAIGARKLPPVAPRQLAAEDEPPAPPERTAPRRRDPLPKGLRRAVVAVVAVVFLACGGIGGGLVYVQYNMENKDKSSASSSTPVVENPTVHDVLSATHLAYSADGMWLATEHLQIAKQPQPPSVTRLAVWSAQTGALRAFMMDPGGENQQIAMAPDGSKVAALNLTSRQVKVWNAATGAPTTIYGLPKMDQIALSKPLLAFSADGQFIYAGVGDKLAVGKFKEQSRLMQLVPIEVKANEMVHMAYSPTSNVLAVISTPILGAGAAELHIYDLSKPGEPRNAPLQPAAHALAFSPDGKTLAVACGPTTKTEASAELFDTSNWKLRNSLPSGPLQKNQYYDRIAIWGGPGYLAGAPSIGVDNNCRAVLLDSAGKAIREVDDQSFLTDMAFSSNGKTLALGMMGERIHFIDTATGQDQEP